MIRKSLFLIIAFICSNIRAESNPQYTETFEISTGHNHVCALTAIGAKCFGNAESVTTKPPVKNLKNSRSLETGNRFSCLITDEGIRCWGEIPNTTKTDILINNSTLPKPKILSVGYEHACAVSSKDRIKCWGRNDNGESSPPRLKRITELSLGMSNSCAIANGKVVCWGLTVAGSTDVPENLINPRNLTSGWWHHCVQTDEGIKCWGSSYKDYVAPDDPNIKEFTSGGFFNCAMLSEGVKCWNEKGKTSLVEGSVGAYKLSVGSTIACAVTVNAGVICWKLSNKGVYNRMLSYVPSGGISKIEFLSAGEASTCAYGDESKLKCWGANIDGALNVPAVFPGPISQLSSGSYKSCVIKDSLLSCWGNSNVDYDTPVDLGNVSLVSSGGNHVCAGSSEKIRCWGDNIRGALDVPKDLTNFSQLSSGFLHTCAVSNDQVTCWGGEGLIKNINNPQKIINPKAICAGGTFSCAITENGKVQCWGEKIPFSSKSEEHFSLNEVLNVPAEIADAVEISCGLSHGCAIYKGKIKCWGTPVFIPERLAPPSTIKNPRMLTAGRYHTCAVGDNGLSCWGTMIGMDMPNYSLEK